MEMSIEVSLGALHALEVQEEGGGVDDRNVHGHADGAGLFDAGGGGEFGSLQGQVRGAVDGGLGVAHCDVLVVG